MPSRRRRPSSSQSSPHRPGTGRRPRARGSNAARAARLPAQTSDLDAVFDFVLEGAFDAAQAGAHTVAQEARAAGGGPTVSHAGLVWQVAHAFEAAQDAMEKRRFEAAKTHASAAATHSRALLPTGAVPADDLDKAIASAGQAWTLAKKAADKAAASGAGRASPMVDQHELDHANRGAFCGLATMIMMLRGNGIAQGSDRASLNALASRVYHPGQGTSGAQMAAVLRDKGLTGSTYTTTGTRSRLIASLAGGQSVPLGVTHCAGTVTKLEGGRSARYPHRKVGDRHERRFGASGHWVLVTRFEGSPDKPTAFLVNDPDLGGELRCTPAQLDRMGEGSGAYWMVQQ